MAVGLLDSSDGELTLLGAAYGGKATITVWWEDGRVTHTTYASRRHCYREIEGDALPWKRWEVRVGGRNAK